MSSECIGWKYQSPDDNIITWKPGMNFITTTSTGVSDYIVEQIRKAQDEMIGRAILSSDYIQPYAVVKLNNEKETKKMEAKKCDRCGKLYETENANDMISLLFKQEKISDSDKERYSEFHNNEMRTHEIRIRRCSEYNDKVDLCPDCRESFKKWFENADKEEK